MWNLLEKITEQVTRYSTFFGQLWYIVVFVFRLIVVVTLGGAVYGDEQSAFKCVTQLSWCVNICYNQFAKMSHLRFWGFQLLAVTFPAVIFHFFTLYVAGQIEKLKQMEAIANKHDPADDHVVEAQNQDMKRITRKRRAVGKVKNKQIYSGGELKEVPLTNKIHIAYYFCTILKFALEGVFIYIGYTLFYIEDPRCEFPDALVGVGTPKNCEYSFKNHILLNQVPSTFICRDDGVNFRTGCQQHALIGYQTANIACFTSRPYEKTIFLRYMNCMSFVSLLLCAVELIYLPIKFIFRLAKRNRRSRVGPPNTVYVYRNPPDDPNDWKIEAPPPPHPSVPQTSGHMDIAYTETKN